MRTLPALVLASTLTLVILGASPVKDCPGCEDGSAVTEATSAQIPSPSGPDAWVTLTGTIDLFPGDCWRPITTPTDPRFGICLEASPCTPRVSVSWSGGPLGANLQGGGEICGLQLPLAVTEEGLIASDTVAQGCGHAPCTFSVGYNIFQEGANWGYLGLSGVLVCSPCNNLGMVVR